jgi:hypothetical protein
VKKAIYHGKCEDNHPVKNTYELNDDFDLDSEITAFCEKVVPFVPNPVMPEPNPPETVACGKTAVLTLSNEKPK